MCITSRDGKDIRYEVQREIHFKEGVSLEKTKHLNDCSKLHKHNVYWRVINNYNYNHIGDEGRSKFWVEVVIQASATCTLHEGVFGICEIFLPN